MQKKDTKNTLQRKAKKKRARWLTSRKKKTKGKTTATELKGGSECECLEADRERRMKDIFSLQKQQKDREETGWGGETDKRIFRAFSISQHTQALEGEGPMEEEEDSKQSSERASELAAAGREDNTNVYNIV